MKLTSYDPNYARKMLKNIDEIKKFNEIIATNDEVLTEFVNVSCTKCGADHLSPQVIFNPNGYGTEGAILLEQHHSCTRCGSDSNITESVYSILVRIQEYDQYANLETVV